MEMPNIENIRNLIVSNLLGEASEKDKRELSAWIENSPKNRELFDKISHEEFLERAIADDHSESKKKIWSRIASGTTIKKSRSRSMRWLRVAVSILIPVGMIFAVWQVLRNGSLEDTHMVATLNAGSPRAVVLLPNGEAIEFDGLSPVELDWVRNDKDTLRLVGNKNSNFGTAEISTIRIPRGGEYVVRLEDNTVVFLNADSELKVPASFGKHDRTVWLTGEAYFEVAHDPARPFSVRSGNAVITALGTKFVVRAFENESEIRSTLVSGSVEVTTDKGKQLLVPEMQAKISEEGEIFVEKVDLYPIIAWKMSRIVFRDTRLEDIMTDMERWYDCEVLYSQPEIKDIRFTIDIMKYNDFTEILDLLERIKKISYTVTDRKIILSLK